MQVCKEFLRGRCSRQESECRFAHPPENMNIGADNTVTACIDFIKGRCQRNPCRYFHPPEHLAARVRHGSSGVSVDFPDCEHASMACWKKMICVVGSIF